MFFIKSEHRHDGFIGPRDRDHRLMRPLSFPVERFPSFVDLRKWMTPIEHQQNMNTCSANAFACICEYLIKRHTGYHKDVSRLFIYYHAQIISQRRHIVKDHGANQRDIALGLRKYGFCEERTWPYEKDLLNKEPSSKAYSEASRYTVVPLRIPFDVESILTCLNNEIPVPVDVRLKEHAGTHIQNNHGYLDIPNVYDLPIRKTGSHTILLVGFNHKTKHFIARNSYGEDWGYQGYFYLPYEYLSDSRLVHYHDGLWTIKSIELRTHKLPTVHQLFVPRSQINMSRSTKIVMKR